MKNKNKIIIASSVVATGAIATAAALIPTMLNEGSKNITIETKNENSINRLDAGNQNSSLVDTNKETNKKFKLSFEKLNEESKGKATFEFENTSSSKEIQASFGETIPFKVKYANSKENITLTDLRVYVDNNEAWSLGVYYDSSRDIYEITIPSEDSDWAKELKDRENVELNFKAYFGPKFINDWTYDFSSRTYAIEITENNFVFDDVEDLGHKIVALKENQTYIKPTQFRVYLSGHNIKIKNLTVPKDTQLMFINESEYSNTLDNRPTPIIDLDGGYRSIDAEDRQLKIEGAIGRYGDVEYSRKMQAACGLPVILEENDLDWEWIKKNNQNK